MTPLELLVLGLATWRVSSLLVHEEGPFRIFIRLREATGIKHDDSGRIFQIPDGFLPGILSCVWCSSIWIAGVWLLAWYLIPKPTFAVAIFFATSTVAIVIERICGK